MRKQCETLNLLEEIAYSNLAELIFFFWFLICFWCVIQQHHYVYTTYMERSLSLLLAIFLLLINNFSPWPTSINLNVSILNGSTRIHISNFFFITSKANDSCDQHWAYTHQHSIYHPRTFQTQQTIVYSFRFDCVQCPLVYIYAPTFTFMKCLLLHKLNESNDNHK